MGWVKTDWLVSSKTLEVSVAVIDVGGIIVWTGGVIVFIISILASRGFLGKILSSPDDNNIISAWNLNIFLNNWSSWLLMVMMFVVVLNLNLIGISWVHMSKVLFIIGFLVWDILNKMMSWSLLPLCVIWVVWVHSFIVFFIIFLWGSVGTGLRLNLAILLESTMSIEVSHFVRNVMMLLLLSLSLLNISSFLVTDDLF